MTGLGAGFKPIRTKGLFDAAAYEAANPGAKDYAGGSYEHFKTVGVPAGAKFPSIAPEQVNDSVADKVKSITEKDSPLMQMARTEGLQIANGRGLLNSSMAAGAAQDAMLRYATPIASQDASQDFQRNQNARAFEYSTVAQDREIELQEKLASWNLASSDRNAAAQFLTNMEQIYAAQHQSIMANPNLSAADRTAFLASAKALRDRQLDFVQQMYDVSLDWGQPGSPSAVKAAQEAEAARKAAAAASAAAAQRAAATQPSVPSPSALSDAWRYGGVAQYMAGGGGVGGMGLNGR